MTTIMSAYEVLCKVKDCELKETDCHPAGTPLRLGEAGKCKKFKKKKG